MTKVFSVANGACAHYIMVSKIQWKPFWLATQLYPQNDWTAWVAKTCELWRIHTGPIGHQSIQRKWSCNRNRQVEHFCATEWGGAGREVCWSLDRIYRGFDRILPTGSGGHVNAAAEAKEPVLKRKLQKLLH